MKGFQSTSFGSVTFGDETYSADIWVFPSGEVEEGNKEMARRQFNTSHRVPTEEVSKFLEKGAELLIVGTGQSGRVSLSEDALELLESEG